MWITVVTVLVFITLISSGHTALEISPDRRRYRKYYAILGCKIGSWQPLPPVVGVTLKYFSKRTRIQSKYNQGSTTYRSEELLVMLSIRNSTTGIIINRFSPDEIELATDFATEVAKNFSVPLNMYLPAH